MNSNNLIRKNDLVSNPTPRIPICLCLDTSGSMKGAPIEELNRGVQTFYDAIKRDEIAYYSAEICVVTFGGNEPTLERDFSSMELQPDAPELSADSGFTPMGEAIQMAIDRLDQRKAQYQRYGVDYYQPWLVLMTDGVPFIGDSEAQIATESDALTKAQQLIRERVADRKLTLFPIGIGENASMDIMKMLSPNRDPLRLQGLKFNEFFEWLSKSVSRVSQSMPGERISLDMEGIKGWAEL